MASLLQAALSGAMQQRAQQQQWFGPALNAAIGGLSEPEWTAGEEARGALEALADAACRYRVAVVGFFRVVLFDVVGEESHAPAGLYVGPSPPLSPGGGQVVPCPKRLLRFLVTWPLLLSAGCSPCWAGRRARMCNTRTLCWPLNSQTAC